MDSLIHELLNWMAEYSRLTRKINEDLDNLNRLRNTHLLKFDDIYNRYSKQEVENGTINPNESS